MGYIIAAGLQPSVCGATVAWENSCRPLVPSSAVARRAQPRTTLPTLLPVGNIHLTPGLRAGVFPRRLLGLVRPETGASSGRLASMTTAVDALEPEVFLRRSPGLPRTFWETQQTWTATLGATARIELRAPSTTNGHEDGHAPATWTDRILTLPADPTHDRAQAIQAAAADLLEGHVSGGDQAPPRTPRFLGGLSFHPGHRPTGPWSGFPAACFLLPSLTLAHGPAGTTLTATVATGPQASSQEALATAHQALQEAEETLSQPFTFDPPETTTVLDQPNGRPAWDAAVGDALAAIDEGDLDKVVLARTLEAKSQGPPDPISVLARLRSDNPGTHRFYIEPTPGSVFLGAAPEVVAQATGRRFTAQAVAGSIPRGQDPDHDDELTRELLDSKKDRAEHALVVDHMRRRLHRVTDRVEIGPRPHVLRLRRIQHLETDIRAELPADVHLLETLDHLHPTPAVCGTPRDLAQAFLRGHEPFERGWYAGPVGWFDATGDGCFAPGLRSAVLQDGTWHLYAGAGIVDGSRPDREWEETRIKFEPILRALALEEAP